ncbi:PspC domain-containing protein [Actinosynnema sp. NPDC050436]|uniref:PspC domain-containing protein n=1 Tax=Actinosynnema sp. NPDC050436 TaxID=3155659 RepID=UPI0033D8C844
MATSALSRPRDNRRVTGVCTGLAQRWGMKPGTVRLLVLSRLFRGPQILTYIAVLDRL